VISARSRIAFGAYLAASTAFTVWLLPWRREPPPTFEPPRSEQVWPADPEHPAAVRDLALSQAKVWRRTDPGAVDLGANPADRSGALSGDLVRCKYLSTGAHGTTAKFACLLPDGEVVKVKYGHTGEIHAEIAATRLLSALGFGADRMYLVPRLRCYGCVRTPFYTVWALDFIHARDLVLRRVPDDEYADFEWVAIERRFEGATIEAGRSSSSTTPRNRARSRAASAMRCASRPCSWPIGTTRPPISGWYVRMTRAPDQGGARIRSR
jgi:hypothetical protein